MTVDNKKLKAAYASLAEIGIAKTFIEDLVDENADLSVKIADLESRIVKLEAENEDLNDKLEV